MKVPKRQLSYVEVIRRRNREDDEMELRMLARDLKNCIDWDELFLVAGELKFFVRNHVVDKHMPPGRRLVPVLDLHTSVGCILLRYDDDATTWDKVEAADD